MEINMDLIKKFINEEQQIKVFPSKQAPRLEIIKYLASFFDTDKEYTEKEVNEIITAHHTFNDITMLRRELINNKHLSRTTDGSKYWVNKQLTKLFQKTLQKINKPKYKNPTAHLLFFYNQ